jgi:O-antigen ligase
VAAGALTLLLAAGWVPALPVLAFTLPLPALYDSPALRVAPAAAVTTLILAAWVLGQGAAPSRRTLGQLPKRATVALLGAVVLAALFAEARPAAIREVLNLGLLLGLLAVATATLRADRRAVHVLALTIAAVAGAAGVLAMLQAVGIVPGRFELAGTTFDRATLGFGWPNELGVFFAVSVPLSWYALRTAGGPLSRLMAAAGLMAAGFGLLATFSRGSWLALLLSAGIFLLSGEARLLLRLGFGVAAAAGLADLASGGVVIGRLLSLVDDPYVVQRAALMLVAVLMFLANPIVGVGPGGFQEHLGLYGPRVSWLWDYVGSAHNMYLEMGAETGVLGLGALLTFLGGVLVVLLRSARRAGYGRDGLLRRALLWSFTAACLAGFTVWPFAHGIGQLVMLVAAMGIALAPESS